MERRIGILFPVVATSLLLATSVLVFAAERPSRPERDLRPEDSRIAGQYIVVLKDSTIDVDDLENKILQNARGERLASYRSALRGFAARIPDDTIKRVRDNPEVLFVSEDRAVSIDRHNRDIPSAMVATQVLPKGVDRVDAENILNKGIGVGVAVIDTGILVGHPDLSGNIVGGKSCVNSTGGYSDQNGHGTHVAGTIAGIDNSQGVVGVAPDVDLWSVRVLDRYGSGSWSSVICGIDFVTSKAPANGGSIKVANMSLGGSGMSDGNCGNSNNDALHKAICRARDAGVTIVVAAGNNGTNAANHVPSAYDDAVITVSALVDTDGKPNGSGAGTSYGNDDTFASFSNWGSVADIGAPGVNIYSAWLGDGYNTISGTSMAAPHVAGAAALYVAQKPEAQWSEVRDALIASGEKLGEGHSDPSGIHPESVLQVDTLAELWSSEGGSVEPPTEELPPEPDPEPIPDPTPIQNYAESFENGLSWTQDSQNDWKLSTQRATDGRYSIEVDGRANNAIIMSDTIGLGGLANAVISFDWYIERRLDSGEYIAFDISTDGGVLWQEKAILRGNLDAEDTWHNVNLTISEISSIKLRFRGRMSSSSEDANVDNILVTF